MPATENAIYEEMTQILGKEKKEKKKGGGGSRRKEGKEGGVEQHFIQ